MLAGSALNLRESSIARGKRTPRLIDQGRITRPAMHPDPIPERLLDTRRDHEITSALRRLREIR